MKYKTLRTFSNAFIIITILASCSNDKPLPAPVEDIPEFTVSTWDNTKAYNGTTLFGYDDGVGNKRIIEVEMDGTIAWEYTITENGTLTDVEYLPNGNILYGVKGVGLYEVDRNKVIQWSYIDNTVWHDVDRLANGNTLFTCGQAEFVSQYPYADPQVKEINSSGTIVWQWAAKDHYLLSKYDTNNVSGLYPGSEWRGDWTHVNGAERLTDGTTMISIRNWDIMIIVDTAGNTLQEIGSGDPGWPILSTLGLPDDPHNPIMLGDKVAQYSGAWWNSGNILISIPWEGRAIVLDTVTGNYTWEWPSGGWQTYGEVLFIRDARPLPNGNIMVVDASGSLIEVTQAGETVWHFRLSSYPAVSQMTNYVGSYMVFFKAERYGSGNYLGW